MQFFLKINYCGLPMSLDHYNRNTSTLKSPLFSWDSWRFSKKIKKVLETCCLLTETLGWSYWVPSLAVIFRCFKNVNTKITYFENNNVQTITTGFLKGKKAH